MFEQNELNLVVEAEDVLEVREIVSSTNNTAS
jgi:hypothetical protein